MARRVPGPSRFIAIACLMLLGGCTDKQPVHLFNESDTEVRVAGDRTLFNNQLANGVLFALNSAHDTLYVSPFKEGLQHGTSRYYYPGGKLQQVRYFENGWKQGTHLGYYDNGVKMYEYHFKDDMFEGSFKEWFRNGRLFRNFNFEKGQEQGTQQVWYDDGTIKTNYVIKDGRRYGLLGKKNCENVSDKLPAAN